MEEEGAPPMDIGNIFNLSYICLFRFYPDATSFLSTQILLIQNAIQTITLDDGKPEIYIVTLSLLLSVLS